MTDYEGPFNDEPGVLFFDNKPHDGWERLIRYPCNGFALNHLFGFVKPLQVAREILPVLTSITSEDFCRLCNPPSLDWGVDSKHEQAYRSFVYLHGLVPGETSWLRQAVYPLAATADNLARLGVAGVIVPEGAKLLILGWNCE
jgi:hypothetical protein